MRPSHALIFILTTIVGLLLSVTTAKADLEKLSLRGSFSLEDESETAYLAFPLMLDLSLGGQVWMKTSATPQEKFSIWEKDEILDRTRPRKRFNPFGSQNSFELFGAQVFKSEVRLKLSEKDSIVGTNPSLSVVWGKGSIAGLYQSEVDLGYDIGVVQLRAKVEMRKEPKPENYVEVSPLDQKYKEYFLIELYKKF